MMIGICLVWVLLGAQDAQKPPVAVPVPVQAPLPIGVQPGDRVTVHFLATLKRDKCAIHVNHQAP